MVLKDGLSSSPSDLMQFWTELNKSWSVIGPWMRSKSSVMIAQSDKRKSRMKKWLPGFSQFSMPRNQTIVRQSFSNLILVKLAQKLCFKLAFLLHQKFPSVIFPFKSIYNLLKIFHPLNLPFWDLLPSHHVSKLFLIPIKKQFSLCDHLYFSHIIY